MDESGGDRVKETLFSDAGSGRGGALSDLAQFLLDNPWLNQALQVAFDARERASQASAQAMRGVGVSSTSETDRLGRRLRALSDRLESLEDAVDRIERRLTQMQKDSTSGRGPGV
jgi:hypothetical protein